MNDSLISSSIRRGRIRSRLFGAVMAEAGDSHSRPLCRGKSTRQRDDLLGISRTLKSTRKHGERQPPDASVSGCLAAAYAIVNRGRFETSVTHFPLSRGGGSAGRASPV